jgi:hypothetical protein
MDRGNKNNDVCLILLSMNIYPMRSNIVFAGTGTLIDDLDNII